MYDNMKSASRSKLLHCFRPMVDMDVAIEPERSEGLGFACDLSGDEMRLGSEKKRTFCRAVKAVFFETVLSKRVRDGKCDKLKTKVIDGEVSLIHKNRTSTTLSSSSSSRSSSSASDSDSPKRKVNDSKSKEESNNRRNDIVLCFLLISLAVTVLCGRFLAIVFTSVWLYAQRKSSSSSSSSPRREDEKRKVMINN